MIIIIHCMHGLGNKVFDLMIGGYVQKINGGEIYFVNSRSSHDKKTDPKIDEIFPNLKKNVKFIRESEMHELKDKYKGSILEVRNSVVKNLEDLDFKNKYDVVYFFNTFFLYKYIYQIYSKFTSKIIENFQINSDLITKKVSNIANTSYAAIHIRYGDKLDLSMRKEKKYNYLIYHPRFYIKMINKFIKNNVKVYIVTDEEKIVKKFILDKIESQDKVKLLEIPSVEALYILSHAKYLVISASTFSIFAAFINEKLSKTFLVTRHQSIDRFKTSDEYILDYFDKNYYKYSDKKYILNYDQDLIKKMIEFR